MGSSKGGQSSWKQPLSRSGGKKSRCWLPQSQSTPLKAVCVSQGKLC